MPVRMTIYQKKQERTNASLGVEKRELLYGIGGIVN